jgi:oxygen-independent coproporphyrinogen-3 oxidase
LGVQAAQDHHLAALHREHSVETAHTAIRWARRVGFNNISVDAIYGLPGQTLAEWRCTLQTLVSWEPDHLSLYALQVEEHTALWRSVHRGETVLPQEDLVGDMGDWAETRLPAWGYARYEVSNFARPGFESQHNRAYWRHRPYLGVGAGAHSFSGVGPDGATRWWNGPNVRRYVADALAGRDLAGGCEQVDLPALAGEFVWLGLRETVGVSLAHFAEIFGVSLSVAFPGVVEPLVRQHLLVQENDRLYLTRRGLAVGNQVFRQFLSAVGLMPASAPVIR